MNKIVLGFPRSLIRGTVGNKGGLIVPKSKKEGGHDRRKPSVPRTNIICFVRGKAGYFESIYVSS
jgi:hypothetical protein